MAKTRVFVFFAVPLRWTVPFLQLLNLQRLCAARTRWFLTSKKQHLRRVFRSSLALNDVASMLWNNVPQRPRWITRPGKKEQLAKAGWSVGADRGSGCNWNEIRMQCFLQMWLVKRSVVFATEIFCLLGILVARMTMKLVGYAFAICKHLASSHCRQFLTHKGRGESMEMLWSPALMIGHIQRWTWTLILETQ